MPNKINKNKLQQDIFVFLGLIDMEIKAKEITKCWKINMMEDRPGGHRFH